MPGWDYYTVSLSECGDLTATLEKLGRASWELVAVDSGLLFFKRYNAYGEGLRIGAAAENEVDCPGTPDNTCTTGSMPFAREQAGQRKIEAITTQDAGVDGVRHCHRVVALVDKDMRVIYGKTDSVDGHTHDVKVVGLVEEADGHTHTFKVE